MTKRETPTEQNVTLPSGFSSLSTFKLGMSAVTAAAWDSEQPLLLVGYEEGLVSTYETNNWGVVSTYRPHIGTVNRLTVSKSSRRRILSCGLDGSVTIAYVDQKSKPLKQRFPCPIADVQWVSNSAELVAALDDGRVVAMDFQRELSVTQLGTHGRAALCIAVSPNGRYVAGGFVSGVLRVWDRTSNTLGSAVHDHAAAIEAVEWSPDGKWLVTCSADHTVGIRHPDSGKLIASLEGHTGPVTGLSFSSEGRVLATSGADGTVRFWRTEMWDLLSHISLPRVGLAPRVLFRPKTHDVCVIYRNHRNEATASLITIDVDALVSRQAKVSTHYTNAKVVLLGDSGVGKSGLSLVLTGKSFQPTESTHGRRVWQLSSEVVRGPTGVNVTREALLWDLAGQPGYRLVHQLNLQETAVALVLFDGRSETDPFSGVKHWDRAIRYACLAEGRPMQSVRKFLVEARIDRGGVGVSDQRKHALAKEMKFDGVFKTSSKEGWGIAELSAKLGESIPWDELPVVSTNHLFTDIKAFLIGEKTGGRMIATSDDLYQSYVRSRSKSAAASLLDEFLTCIRLLEARNLVRRMSFGGLVLLQPEYIDAYASAMVNAAREEPDGLGCIVEEDCVAGRFRMSSDERASPKTIEQLVILATIEDLLKHEIAIREQSPAGSQLIFPSQLTREYPEFPEPPGRSLTIRFEGPTTNVYATLVVRLSHSGIFGRPELWQNAAIFSHGRGNQCGVSMSRSAEGQADITIFFTDDVRADRRDLFEAFVKAHVEARALPASVIVIRAIVCDECETPITELQKTKRIERGFDWMECGVCQSRVQLVQKEDLNKRFVEKNLASGGKQADAVRDKEVASTIVRGKRATNDYDVFLAHNSKNKKFVAGVSDRLEAKGISTWLDDKDVPPGRWFQQFIQDAIPRAKSAAIFLGKEGLGRWEELELRAFVSRAIEQGIPVIPVLLPGLEAIPKQLVFLEQLNYVRFGSESDGRGLAKLIWGITERDEDRDSYLRASKQQES